MPAPITATSTPMSRSSMGLSTRSTPSNHSEPSTARRYPVCGAPTPGHECPVVGPKPAVLACLLALSLAACGTGGRERDAAAVAERFHAALERDDGQAACAELNPETASKLEE